MRHRIALSSLTVMCMLLLCMIAVIPVVGTDMQQMNPTDQQGTVDALVNERFTATAEAEASNYSNQPTENPTQTPIPTLTLMPSPTFEGSFASLDANLSSNAIPVRISDEAFEHYTEGWEQFWREDFRDAEDEFQELIELEPEWAEGYFSLAIAYIAQDDFEDAIDAFDVGEQLANGINAGIATWRVYAYNELEETDAAIADGEIILDNNPYDVIGLYNLAFAYFIDDDYEAVVDTLNIAILFQPTNSESFDLRRDAHDVLGWRDDERFDEDIIDGLDAWNDNDFDDARDAFESALERAEDTSYPDFNTAIAHWFLALVDFFENDIDDALDTLELAEEAYPAFGHIYFLRHFLLQDGDFGSEIINNLDDGIQTVPNFPDLYIQRALYNDDNNQQADSYNDLWRFLQATQTYALLWENQLELGEELSLPVYNGWEHHFTVSAEAGDRISVTADENSVGVSIADPLIVILDPDGNVLVGNDDANDRTLDAEISRFELSEDGDYRVIVGVSTGDNGGIIDIEIDLD